MRSNFSAGQVLVCAISSAWALVAGYYGFGAVAQADYGLAAVLGTIVVAFCVGIYLTLRRRFAGLVVACLAGILGPLALIPWFGWPVLFVPILFPCLFQFLDGAAMEM